MADILMEKQQKQRGRGRGRPFEKGQSGNPAGRPPGTGKRATGIMQLMLDAEAQALTRKAVELALDGNTMALRMCLDRIGPPRRERAVPIKLPPVRDAADLAGTMTAIIAAAGEGAISADRAAVWRGSSRSSSERSRRATSNGACSYWKIPIQPRPIESDQITRRGWRR
jgi:hypothetical protein